MSGWIPDQLLAKWLLLVGVIATFSGLQSFVGPTVTRKVYVRGGANITPLSGRTFAIWNILSAVIRISCAYDMHNKSVYHLTMFSFALALAHFGSECAAFRTASLNSPAIVSAGLTASTSLVLMSLQYRSFVA